ncbi:MAG: DNA-binding transcriptional ArsR family regulator [Candidatus Woesearchaeota archaeon]|jgi:DNA-binding transcriptional ArsR family regulator
MICNTYIKFFKTIAEPSRVELLFHLLHEDMCVSDLALKTKREQSSISHSLKILKDRGFVIVTVSGKHRVYSLTKEGKTLLVTMDKHIKKYFHGECKCKK